MAHLGMIYHPLPTKAAYLASLTRVTWDDVQALCNDDRHCRVCGNGFQILTMRGALGDLPARVHHHHYMCDGCIRQACERGHQCPRCQHRLFEPAAAKEEEEEAEAEEAVKGDVVARAVEYDADRNNYTTTVVPLAYLPRRIRKLDATPYLASMRAGFAASRANPTGPHVAVVHHPLAAVAGDTLARALARIQGTQVDAAAFATALEQAVNGEPLLRDLHRQSVDGALPKGMQAYVKDQVELALRWFVGPLRRNREGGACVRVQCRERGCGCVGVARMRRQSCLVL
ncbi:hypothetical protein LTR36_004981 [Oleoguttula mirabilis]|uniref:RING-type domain-containing protein n=1 Tax=Oleoguttula mirabilis TaxID=1507867 RepID=A0AAV9JVS2_9PEZI|nr:hypothetical protein LTR36_004981 [Oleoguttula mirabilis]